MEDLKKGENRPTNYIISTGTRIMRTYHHFSINHPWISSIFVYICIICIVEGIGLSLSYNFNFVFSNIENARYVLSGLAQCQAAIIAIVVTMTLVIIQLSAGSYSHRVVELYKKNPNMWLLLVFYLSGIILDFFLIQSLRVSNTTINSNSISQESVFLGFPLNTFITIAFYFGVFTFIALIIFLIDSINLVKSKDLIERLIPKITKNHFLTDDDEVLRSLFDIIQGSIKNYDRETAHDALEKFRERLDDIYNSELSYSQKSVIVNKISSLFIRCCHIAVYNDEEELTRDILITYNSILSISLKECLHINLDEITDSIKDIGLIAAQRRLSNVIDITIYILGELGKQAASKNEERITNNIVMAIYEIGKITIEQQLEKPCFSISVSLNSIRDLSLEKSLPDVSARIFLKSIDLGKRTADEGIDHATVWFIQSAHIIAKENFKQQKNISFYFPLMEIGKITLKNHLLNSSLEIIRDLDEIGKISLESDQVDPLNQIIRFYFDLISVSISNRDYNNYNYLLQQLEKKGVAIIDKHMSGSSLNFCFQIRNIGFFCIEKHEEILSLQSIILLNLITEKCLDSGFTEMADHSIHSIRDIGGFALDNGYEFVAHSIVSTLDNLESKSTDIGLIDISKRSINGIYKIYQIAISNFYEDVVEFCIFKLLFKTMSYSQNGKTELYMYISELLSDFKTENSVLFNKMMKKVQRRFGNEYSETLQKIIDSL